jgi:hypothetical protein
MLGECSDDLVIRVTDLCEHPGLIHPDEGTCGISQYQAFSALSVCARRIRKCPVLRTDLSK